ncbi:MULTISPECIES: SMP-30/gluconolactonase/LRE family protein [Chryseobacterium]|uniref:Gluconolactonase n=1 Tax=Chryseobacterium taihuense TaxID=1141221 RepID=A0A4U8W9L5_9FLAO|nr:MULTISPECIES: SMP-30/gluconolactonase/LRE family protein [Chryseobacterium]QQV03703.1 SMP-30/gluconolactonase/LRE family protein [Chryseobacterium sp. FDAARGOS 1104]VFB02957.1 Gluconolactonase precursor [Chryseobacterium taihuense]
MKKEKVLGIVGLILVLFSCQSTKYKNMFEENTEPKLISDQFSFTEGPSADTSGNVYFTDQPNDKIYLWDWKTNKIELFLDKTGRANGTFFDENDNLITCSDNEGEIWKISKDKSVEVLSKGFEGKRLNGPNDLWLDDFGGIYFTDPLYERDYWENFKVEIPEKNLYYRNKNGAISKIETFVQPNGIIGSKKLKKLYVSDIDGGKTYVYDILGEGQLSEKKLFCEMGSDGMTLDQEGNLYITGDGVTVFNNKGEKIHHIKIPEDWTGNVTFGGEKNNILFITASKSVYTLPTKTRGLH